MTHVAFPLGGPLIVLGLVLPLSALVTKLLLLTLARLGGLRLLEACHNTRHLLLVISSAAPLIALMSASAYQLGAADGDRVCITVHHPGALCREATLFLVVLASFVLLIAAYHARSDPAKASCSPSALRMVERVERLVREHAGLAPLGKRVIVSDGAAQAIATMGLVRPCVLLQTGFASRLDDVSLTAALYHEVEHLKARDPLRYFISWWALAVNPLGAWLLGKEYARWHLVRETECDRLAVVAGASPTALARALLAAARPASSSTMPALGSGPIAVLKLRLGLLLAYADQPPQRRRGRPTLRLLVAAILLASTLPHNHAGAELLDKIHVAAESAVAMGIAVTAKHEG